MLEWKYLKYKTVLQVAMSFKYLKKPSTASKKEYWTVFVLLKQSYKQTGCPKIQGETDEVSASAQQYHCVVSFWTDVDKYQHRNVMFLEFQRPIDLIT